MQNSWDWQYNRFKEQSDDDLLIGIIRGKPCDAAHWKVIENHLETDICIMYSYRAGEYRGMYDHFNLRWLYEWIRVERPHLLDKLDKLLILK